MKCSSCNKEICTEGVIFKCPNCGHQIARCVSCRKLSIKYKCKCGFEGP